MNKKTDLITKNNDLINASYNLSVQETRLMGLMCSQIHPDDDDFQKYIINISEFLDLLEIKDNSYHAKVKMITRSLLSRVLTIKQPDGLLQVTWLSSAKYFDGQGIVQLSFDPQMKPYLLQLKEKFTSYRLANVLELSSQYAYRLYEILKQYQVAGRRVIELKELRWSLNIEKSYERWSALKDKVLNIAEREINEKTDINISWKPIKTGRKITALDFTIRTNLKNKTSPENDLKNCKRIEDLEGLLRLVPEKYNGLKTIHDAIQMHLKKFGPDYVKRNISYANKHAKKNYRAYLINSLKGDWGLQEEEDKEVIKKVKKENDEKIKQQQTEIEKEYERDERISELKKSIPDEEIERYIEKYLEDNPAFKKTYTVMRRRSKENAFKIIKRQIIIDYFL